MVSLTFHRLSISGDGQVEGAHDADRQHHDQLPAARDVPQLLPQHHLQPGGQRERRRLHALRDGEARTRPLDSPLSRLSIQRMRISTLSMILSLPLFASRRHMWYPLILAV